MNKTSKLKKLAAAVLVPVVLTAAPAHCPAAAPDTGIVSPNYTAIANVDNLLTLESNNNLNCYAYTSVYRSYTAKVTVELQQSNGGWETIETWTDKGGTSAVVNEDYTAKSGKYRLKVTHSSYNSSGKLLDSVAVYSDTVTV